MASPEDDVHSQERPGLHSPKGLQIHIMLHAASKTSRLKLEVAAPSDKEHSSKSALGYSDVSLPPMTNLGPV